MWTMRLRRTGRVRGQRDALPTAAPFAHMPTASHYKRSIAEENDNLARVTFLCEATRQLRIVDAGQFTYLDRWGCLLHFISERIAPVIGPTRPSPQQSAKG